MTLLRQLDVSASAESAGNVYRTAAKKCGTAKLRTGYPVVLWSSKRSVTAIQSVRSYSSSSVTTERRGELEGKGGGVRGVTGLPCC